MGGYLVSDAFLCLLIFLVILCGDFCETRDSYVYLIRTICLVSLIHAHKNAGWVLQNLWFLSNHFMVSSSMKLGWPLQ